MYLYYNFSKLYFTSKCNFPTFFAVVVLNYRHDIRVYCSVLMFRFVWCDIPRWWLEIKEQKKKKRNALTQRKRRKKITIVRFLLSIAERHVSNFHSIVTAVFVEMFYNSKSSLCTTFCNLQKYHTGTAYRNKYCTSDTDGAFKTKTF